jgi:hypothetical protein
MTGARGRVGIDVPDQRGRTGLDRAGRDLDRNPDVVVGAVEVTENGWHVLRRTTFDDRRRDGTWTTQQRDRSRSTSDSICGSRWRRASSLSDAESETRRRARETRVVRLPPW